MRINRRGRESYVVRPRPSNEARQKLAQTKGSILLKRSSHYYLNRLLQDLSVACVVRPNSTRLSVKCVVRFVFRRRRPRLHVDSDDLPERKQALHVCTVAVTQRWPSTSGKGRAAKVRTREAPEGTSTIINSSSSRDTRTQPAASVAAQPDPPVPSSYLV